MQHSVWQLATVLAGAVLVQGCDRKSEAPQAENLPSDSGVAAEAINTTVVAVAGPEGDAGPEAGVTVVGVSVTTIVPRGNRDVVERIADARCQREQRCGNVGSEKEYASLDACKTKIATDWREELNLYECPGGFDRKELDECTREIQNEDCGRPFDRLERIIACRSSDICRATR